jgi:hypothetical protein
LEFAKATAAKERDELTAKMVQMVTFQKQQQQQ